MSLWETIEWTGLFILEQKDLIGWRYNSLFKYLKFCFIPSWFIIGLLSFSRWKKYIDWVEFWVDLKKILFTHSCGSYSYSSLSITLIIVPLWCQKIIQESSFLLRPQCNRSALFFMQMFSDHCTLNVNVCKKIMGILESSVGFSRVWRRATGLCASIAPDRSCARNHL